MSNIKFNVVDMANFTIANTLNNDICAKYMQQVKSFPMLSQEEELKFANDWIENKNLKSAHKLVTSHLRLVVKIAMNFRTYGLPIMDLISEGTIGLMKAVKKFQPKKGNRLSTYAMWWIKACIQEYIVKSWSMLKIGSSILQKKLFSNLNGSKEKILNYENRNFRSTVSNSDYYVRSLNEPIGDGQNSEFIDIISDDAQNQEEILTETEEKNIKKNSLKIAIKKLNDREKDILNSRKLSEKPLTLDILSKRYNVSSERIRQIEEIAIKKIRKEMIGINI
jgi:RNA polymerase sigma-32 factor